MKTVKLLVVLAVLLGCSLVRADLITIAITGTVTSVLDVQAHLENKIHAGDTFTGTYIYNSDTPDSSSSSSVGDYEYFAAPYGISLNMGGLIFATDSANTRFLIETVDNHPTGVLDGYLVSSYNNLSLSNGTFVDYIYWTLQDYTGNAINSDSLPLTAPDLDAWSSNYLHISSLLMGGFEVQGTITSAVVVPEPCTVLLLVTGFAIIRRRQIQH